MSPDSDRPVAPRLSDRRFRDLAEYLRSTCGIQLAPRKRVMVESRLLRRLRERRTASFDDYCRLLFDERDDAERTAVIDLLTTHKTDFFRERHHFDFLVERIARPFRRLWPRGERQLRIWSAGCSTGEEPYSIAMAVDDVLGGCPPRVLATDVSVGTLASAEHGVYDGADLEPVPAPMRRQFFRRDGGAFEVSPELRSRVSFRRHNLMDEEYPSPPRHHVIFCRNTLVYFDRPTQQRVLTRMTRALAPRGFLFLGHSESMTGMGLPFDSVGPTIFRKR